MLFGELKTWGFVGTMVIGKLDLRGWKRLGGEH